MSGEIRQFRGEYFFLSNMYPVPDSKLQTPDGIAVGSSEQVYMATRFLDLCDRIAVASVRGAAIDTRSYKDGMAAKSLAHSMIAEGRLHYSEPHERLALMEIALQLKFNPVTHPDLVHRLVSTGSAQLIEGNTWGDTFWGVDRQTGEGDNNLGKLLMKIRGELRT